MNIHITHSFSYPYSCSSERRFCMRDLRDAHETLGALRDIEGNEAMKAANNLFTNPEALRRYPELQHALDRTIFLSLFFGSALPTGQKYVEVTHETLNLTNPFGLVKSDVEGAGVWLRQTLEARPDVIQKLGDDPSDLGALGQNYFDRIDRTKAAWEEKDVSRIDPLILDAAVERYRYAKRILSEERIAIPESESAFQRSNALSRKEYLALMTILWRGSVTREDIQRARRGGFAGIRSLIGDPGYVQDVAKAHGIYTDLSSGELGHEEMLHGLDIDPGVLRQQFLLYRKLPPEQGGISSEMIGTVANKGEGTRRAFLFLKQWIPPTTRNIAFMSALGFYIDKQWGADIDPDPLSKLRALTDKEKERVSHMSQKDVLALLEVIRSHLQESEQTLHETNVRQKELFTERTRGEKIEEEMGNVWEYMKSFRDHPLGSGLMWVTAALLVAGTWGFLRKSHSKWTKLLFLGAVGGSAIALYQQHKGNPSWIENIFGRIEKWKGKEAQKSPEKQKVLDYWARVVDTTEMRDAREVRAEVSTHQALHIFAVLKDQPLKCVLDWYELVDKWHLQHANTRGRNPPPTAKLDLGMVFGDPVLSKLDRRDAVLKVYEVLRRFFVDRGRKVRASGEDALLRPSTLAGSSVDEKVGNAYITQKYTNTMHYKDLMRNTVRENATEEDLQILGPWQPGEGVPPELQTVNPKLYDELIALTWMKRAKAAQIESCAKTTVWDVLFFEENFEILRRQRGGAQPATYLQQLANYAHDTAHSMNPFRTDVYPERASRVILFSEAERSLFASDALGDSKFLWVNDLPGDEKAVVRERLTGDFDAFLKRLPLTDAAKEKLRWYLMEFAMHWKGTLSDLLNEVERKKYHILIAAQKSENRLSAALEKSSLDPENDKTWKEFFDTWVSDWGFDDWHHPAITKLDDLYGLFNSEAYQHGGVKWWEYWYRMFPRWEQSKMYEFYPVIQEYKKRFDQMRAKPNSFLLLNPALGVPPSKEMIDSLEMHVARRFAVRLFEAMLVTHGRGTVVDGTEDRNVSPIEQQNLKEYFDAVFTGVTGWRPQLTEKIEKVEKQIAAIRVEKYASNAGLHVQIDPTQDSIKVGLLVGTRYVSNLPYIGRLLPTEFLYPIELTTKDFVEKPANHIIHDWKVHAMRDKCAEIGGDLQAEYSGNSIGFWYPTNVQNAANMPIQEFLQATKEQILNKLQ